ncbi:NUMOD4 domain-containing protein [Segatella buccae]
MEEYWKPISGFDGIYEVSNLGRIKSLDRIAIGKDGIRQKRLGKILSGQVINSGYRVVHLRKPGYSCVRLVHRVVAETFILNVEDFPYVNHKDENKLNNAAYNLEWCTPKYNANYGSAREKLSKSHLNHPAISKRVLMADNHGNILKSFTSIHEASRITGILNSNICRCSRGEKHYKSAGGYKWYYDE